MCRSDSFRRLYCTICTLIFVSIFDANSYQKFILDCDNAILTKSEEIMKLQAGKIEVPGNRGIAIVYLKTVGLKAGNPYCAAGQYYCFLEAIKALKLSPKLIPITRTGLSRKILKDAMRKGIRALYKSHRHDLIIWRDIRSSWKGHIERVISVGEAGWVTTIGFNVKLPNGNEGVAVKRRNIFHIIGRLKVSGIIGFEDFKK